MVCSMSHRLARWAALLGTVLSTSNALAEGPKGSIALSPFRPALPGDPFFGVPSPFIGGHLVPRGQVTVDHADRPLALASGSTAGAIVGHQTFLHIAASFAVWDRLQLALQMPVALSQGGDSPTVRNVSFDSPTEAQPGDLRASARVRMFGAETDAAQLGAGVHVHVPTGPSSSYVSDGFVRVEPHLLLGGRRGLFVWSLSLGAHIRGAGNPSAVTGGLGAGLTFWGDRLQINVEASAETLFQEGTFRITEHRSIPREIANTGAELLGGGRFRIWEGLVASVGAGPGLTTSIGTPAFRIVGGLAWSPRPAGEAAEAPADPDGDGISGAEDVCPYAFGPKGQAPKHNGCPVRDADEDGVRDDDDACRDQAGEPSDEPKENGCPPDGDADGVPDQVDICPAGAGVPDMNGCPADADRDGVPDREDACPDQQGPRGEDPKKSGCPAGAAAPSALAAPPPDGDGDGDGIAGALDACPHEKGPASATAADNGCPANVRVKGGEVVLLSPIRFGISRNDPAPLDASATAILKDVADVLIQHPEYTKIEVQGHTDNTDKAPANERVSTARAEKVVKWLTEHGVAAGRLVAKGYGATKPAADNTTAAGRARNKRIQIVVTETKK